MAFKLPIAAVLACASPVTAATPVSQEPIRLVVEREDEAIVVTVVGNAQEAFVGAYALEVSSPTAGGHNRSVQRGRANLGSGETATFINLRVSAQPQSDWSARLVVTPDGGLPYEQVRRGSDGPD